LEKSIERTQRTFIRLALGILIAVILLIALFWGGHDVFVRWQERQLIRRAAYALQRGDEREASLAARSMLAIKPSSIGASRILAELAEHAGDRIALDWRRKVVELEPHSAEDALAWARCALQFHEIATAEGALSRVEETGRQTAGYHAVSALLAQARQQDEKAEHEWSEAVRLAPNEKAYELQLGILLLRSRDSERHASGEIILEALRRDPDQRASATRALINEGVARHQSAQRLLALARELQSYPGATLADRLLLLDMLHQLQDSGFSSYLTELENYATEHPVRLAALLAWMNQSNLNLIALDFLKSLPPGSLEKWPVPLAVADVYVQLRDWHKLETLTKAGTWRQADFLRHAYLARALRAQDKPAAAEHEWATAMKQASVQSESILTLVRIVSEWGWNSEAVDLLWALSKYPEKENDAFLSLYRRYAKTGDTPGLYRVLVRLLELDPGNLDLQNNLAQVSLLLNAKPDEARRIAADLYHKTPSNSAYATTYAYALLSKGDATGAGRIMNSLMPDQLRDPAVSAYYGICLAALKDERARTYLEAGQAATLLPEEKALVEKALVTVESRRRTP
jgi:Tfp pilus assembly protein PilF